MKKTVFVVDDNDTNLLAAATALESEYRVLTMPKAESMFSLLKKMRPDIIIVDFALVENSKFNPLVMLKSDPGSKKIPVVCIAEEVDSKKLKKAKTAGAEDLIIKPAPDTVLRNVVRKYTSSRHIPSVLVVDDQETSITELVKILSPEYVVYEAQSGRIAIKEAEKYSPDVIMLDILMPEMDGYAAIEILRKNEKTSYIPIIFVTSLKGHDEEEKGLISGAADYITKPFNPATVKLRVQNQIKIIQHTRSYDQRLRQQELLTKISHSFLSDDRADSLFSDTLRMVGEFMGLAKVLLYKIEDGNIFICHSEWLNPELGLETEIDSEIVLGNEYRALLKDHLASDEHYCINSNIQAHKEAALTYRGDFDDFISTPIYIKGKVCAILDFSREDTGQLWTDSELGLAVLLSDIFSGVFERDAIEYDLNVVLKLKEELDVAKKLAERSSRAKSEFLSRMSHEMLTPMNAIMGMMQIAKRTSSIDEVKDCLNEIGDASNHMVKLIRNVLDVSGGSGAITFERSAFAFNTMLDSILNNINPEINKKKQLLIMDVSESIPEVMIGDQQRLSQVVLHILTNASKFTPEHGEINCTVRTLCEDYDTLTLQFDITDNGIGISAEQQESIFDIFEQMDDSLTRKQGGIGIGLALSKLILEMMNGNISVTSELGKGAKFSFTCVMEKIRSSDNRVPSIDKSGHSVGGTGVKAFAHAQHGSAEVKDKTIVGKRILIVDDVTTNRKVVGGLLRQKGAQVVEAKEGKEAVAVFIAESENIDMILMDLAMPEMDGYEATKMIRASGKPNAETIPIIALTAHADEQHTEEAYASGMNFHLEKPIEPHALFQTLERYIK